MKILILLCLASGVCYAQRPAIAEDYKAAKVKSVTEKLYEWDEAAKSFKTNKERPIGGKRYYDKNGYVSKEEQYDLEGKGAVDAYQVYERDYSGRVLKIKWYDIVDGKPEYAQYSIVEYRGDTTAVFVSYNPETNERLYSKESPLDSEIGGDLRRVRLAYMAGGNKIAKMEYWHIGAKTTLYDYNQDGTVDETDIEFGQSNRKVCKYLYGWLKTEEVVYNQKDKLTAKYVYEIEYYK